MNNKERTYNNTSRARNAGKTNLKIIKATGELWKKLSIHEITLERIAEESGVTVRTIFRKFGSKEALFEECLSQDQDAADIRKNRSLAPVGNPDAILEALLANYEEIGDAAIRTTYLENELEIAKKIGVRGRAEHRQWCSTVFAPYLPEESSDEYELKLSAFIAATEIYLWKLLRRDMGQSREQTFQVFKRLISGLILQTHNTDQL